MTLVAPYTVLVLQKLVITALSFLAGLSSCLSLWVLPLQILSPPRIAAQQLCTTVTWGRRYLLTSSRILGFLILTTTILVANLDDPIEAEKWKNWAVATAVLVSVAPYEIYMIFPINDRVEEIRDEFEGMGKETEVEKERKEELRGLLRGWQRWNFGRVGVPLLVSLIGLFNLVERV